MRTSVWVAKHIPCLWYLLGMGGETDLHTPHWHGNTVLYHGHRTDVVELLPASMKVADMGGTLLQFTAAASKTYSVQHRARLDGSPWLNLTNLPASSTRQPVVVVDTAPSEQRFYRLVTPRQP